MSTLLINAKHPEEIRIASLHISNKPGYKISNLYIEDTFNQTISKNIYLGVITKIAPHLNAAFVNYGSKEEVGFLPFDQVAPMFLKNKDASSILETTLAVGQSIIIQILYDTQGIKDRNTKGPRLTTKVALPSHYWVLKPTSVESGGISRQIVGADRQAMQAIWDQLDFPAHMSNVLRTAGIYATVDTLKENLALLLKQWEAIQESVNTRKAPFLILKEEGILIRAMRDYLSRDIENIIIDEPDQFSVLKDYIAQIRPDLVNKLSLHQSKVPLFVHFNIEDEVEAAFQHTLRLPSGGEIVFDRTEAATTIDVNSKGATKHKNIAETALKTNLEAAELVARQLRLRDLGGLVFIDFIDMDKEADKQLVENKLKECMQEDRARINMDPISPRLGALSLSRQKLRASLAKMNEDTCPHCEGHGIRRSIPSLALSTLRKLEKMLLQRKIKRIKVESSIELATYITNEKRDFLHQLERDYDCTLTVLPNPYWKAASCKITQLTQEESSTSHGLQGTSDQLLSEQASDTESTIQTSSLENPAVPGLSKMSMHTFQTKQSRFARIFNRFKLFLKSLFSFRSANALNTSRGNQHKRFSHKTGQAFKTTKTNRSVSTRITGYKNQNNETNKTILPKFKKGPLSSKKPISEESSLATHTSVANSLQPPVKDKIQNGTQTTQAFLRKPSNQNQILTSAQAAELLSAQGSKKTNNKHMQRFGGEAKMKRRTYSAVPNKETAL